MNLIYTEAHRKRDAKSELSGGELVQPFERPSRMDYILKRIEDQGMSHHLQEPTDFGMAPIAAIHDADYLVFLQNAWQEWKTDGHPGEAIADTSPFRNKAQQNPSKIPNDIVGRLGYYAMASETAISEGTWEAAYWAAQVAATGAQSLIDGEAHAFSLCRPPGHHAHADMFGGYCFLNNAAIATQFLRDKGFAQKIAILDVDFHHGNGTQDIFYDREDVLFASLHGDPMEAFPYFLGHANETGIDQGQGANFNLPLPRNTDFSTWRKGLLSLLEKIQSFAPQALIISLGVDTFKSDPISFFKLESEDFITMGQDIKALNLPTLTVMEGGYDIDEIGINTVNFIQGLKG